MSLNVLTSHTRLRCDRWTELTRKLELWTEIHELNEQGEYVPVENAPKPDVLTGGVFQLRQVTAVFSINQAVPA